jgi:hypothetical protein
VRRNFRAAGAHLRDALRKRVLKYLGTLKLQFKAASGPRCVWHPQGMGPDFDRLVRAVEQELFGATEPPVPADPGRGRRVVIILAGLRRRGKPM